MKHVNRILMIPFCFMLLIGIIRVDFLYLAALIAFVLGVFQLLSSLKTLFDFDRFNMHIKKCIIIYLIFVTVYFVCVFLTVEFLNEYGITIVMYLAPIFLSLFWTYILESIKK